MHNRLFQLLTAAGILLTTASAAHAGFLWFPAPGYYAFSAPVTAVPDLDSRLNYIKTRTGETGSYWDGCLAYVNNANVACNASTNAAAPWAYKRPGGVPWTVNWMNYNDYASSNGNIYMWYDNHHGYDYAIPAGSEIVAPAAGNIVSIDSSWGQITIDHGNGYQTTYTHMNLYRTSLGSVARNERLGYVSNVAPVPVSPHLHFVVKKYVGGQWVVVDPYGSVGEPVLWE